MISRLSARNFQSWEHVDLALAPGVNAIVGASDSGKSALLRMIDWVMRGRGGGEACRRRGGGDMSVAVELTPGGRIERVRPPRGGEVYRVGDLELRAFGNTMPAEVSAAAAMDDVNVQGQFDSPGYLLNATAGEVARELNRAASLDRIDRVTSWLTGRQRAAAAETRAAEAERTRADEDAARPEFAQLDADESVLQRLEAAARELNSAEQWAEALAAAADDLRDAGAEVGRLQWVEKARAADEREMSGFTAEEAAIRAGLAAAGRIERAAEACRLSGQQAALNAEALTRLSAQWDAAMKGTCPLCGRS